MSKICIQLVDDHDLVRAGFKSLIEKTSNYRVVVESSRAESAWRDYLKYQPDVVLMDISMPGIGGVEGIRRILSRDPDARIIVLTMLGQEVIHKVMEIGAKGYVNKASPPSLIVEAINRVARGENYFIPHSNVPDVKKPLDRVPAPVSTLTQREFEIMMLLLSEKSNSEIADILGLSAKTVHVHKSRIFGKLHVTSLVGLTQFALVSGLIEAPY